MAHFTIYIDHVGSNIENQDLIVPTIGIMTFRALPLIMFIGAVIHMAGYTIRESIMIKARITPATRCMAV